MLRSVPIDGKYIPTQASKAKNDAIRTGRLIVDDTTKEAVDMATVAVASMAAVKFSVGIDSLASCPNIVDPNKQEAMKQEKTVP